MSCKTILAYLDSAERAEQVATVAANLAAQHDAHVIGLHVIPIVALYGVVEAQVPLDVIERQRDAMRADSARVQGIFEDAVKKAGVIGEWRSEENRHTDIAAAVIEQAHATDLLVASQSVSENMSFGGDPAADFVLGTGRPVLLVPTAGTYPSVGKSVVIAWNHTREAARAAFDSLALMKKASSVLILSVNPEPRHARESLASGEDLAIAMARHGVKAEAMSTVTKSISVGDEILSRVADRGADLLVMGCYGHSRMREMVFGGATKSILEQMTVPVLMSH